MYTREQPVVKGGGRPVAVTGPDERQCATGETVRAAAAPFIEQLQAEEEAELTAELSAEQVARATRGPVCCEVLLPRQRPPVGRSAPAPSEDRPRAFCLRALRYRTTSNQAIGCLCRVVCMLSDCVLALSVGACRRGMTP